jgi:rhodanese-related sulfurtransferase
LTGGTDEKNGRPIQTEPMKKHISIFSLFLFLVFAVGCAEAQQGGTSQAEVVVDLDAASFKAAIEKGNAVLLDVRTPAEHAAGNIAGNTNIDWNGSDFEKATASLDPAEPVLLYCRSGGRSGQALQFLQKKGFKDVRHLEGGIGVWERAGYPVVR